MNNGSSIEHLISRIQYLASSMIAPQSNIEPVGSTLDIQKFAKAFFEAGGGLEHAIAGGAFPYEFRPQQLAMAEAVAEAVEAQTHLVVEAGTGVGKSFAYLVPLILAAVEQKMQVIVATHTISLQEQLMYKDIPFLQKHIGVDFKAVLVKGRSNYLCLRRLARAEQMGPDLFQKNKESELNAIRKWSNETCEGSLQDMQVVPPGDVWDVVCVEQGNCMWQKCPEYSACFLMKARKRIREAHLLIVNHHLLFSNLALETKGGGFLPAHSVVVIDEAHQMEQVATEHVGLRISQFGFQHWMRRLYNPEQTKGLFPLIKHGKGANAVMDLWDHVEELFAQIHEWAKLETGIRQRTVSEPLSIQTGIFSRINYIISILKEVSEDMKDEDLRAELQSVHRRGLELSMGLESFLHQTHVDHVYWVGLEGRRKKQLVLYSAPIEVAPVLKENLFEKISSVIMTSATLAVQNTLDYFQERVGVNKGGTLRVGSPFRYSQHMRILIPKNMPDPSDAEGYFKGVVKAVKYFVTQSKGRAFVLFTSDFFMKRVADEVETFFSDQKITLLVQGTGMPRHAMLETFQEDVPSVLFGLASFWMGVDVRGEALSNVIITRLPFAVPDQPVTKARIDRIKEQGGDPFKEYSLPEAILKFRQGVGRLIRTATDEGTIVVLDSRVRNKWYGKLFVASIPECPIDLVDTGS
ncbi:MAG: DEAD/DEAH box helicase [Kiritimatiellae bacterium]|nr:DEAD/DEAH box helicase [Kiritimatiellia bacterium]